MVVESHERMKAMDEAIRAVEGVRMLPDPGGIKTPQPIKIDAEALEK